VSTQAAGLELAEKLTAAGIRATTDPGALNPPAVLIPPPRRVYDLACGFTQIWTVHAIAPAITGGDRTSWAALDALVDALADTFPVETAQPGAYVLETKSYPAYQVTFSTPGGDP
jgi:hypothetical protein